MIDLEEIEKRLSLLPDDLEIFEVFVQGPRKNPQDEPKPYLNRVEVRSKSRPKEISFHYHPQPGHSFPMPNWKQHAELQINLYKDLRSLIEEVRKLKGEK